MTPVQVQAIPSYPSFGGNKHPKVVPIQGVCAFISRPSRYKNHPVLLPISSHNINFVGTGVVGLLIVGLLMCIEKKIPRRESGH